MCCLPVYAVANLYRYKNLGDKSFSEEKVISLTAQGNDLCLLIAWFISCLSRSVFLLSLLSLSLSLSLSPHTPTHTHTYTQTTRCMVGVRY